MWPIFKTDILLCQSKLNLDEKILFGKIIYHLDLKLEKCMQEVCMGFENSTFHFGPIFIWH